MTDFDCVNDTCDTPVECCTRDACIQQPERTRVQELIAGMHERLRREK